MKVAFDIGGVLSKYPDEFRELLRMLTPSFEVFVVTDMKPKSMVMETLKLNGFGIFFNEEHVHLADFDTYGEGCKYVIYQALEIDMVYDDHEAYLGLGGVPVRCLVMNDPYRPYWHPTWVLPEGQESNFGRRVFTR